MAPLRHQPAASSARFQRLGATGIVTKPSNSAVASYARQQQLEAQCQASQRRQNQRELANRYASQPYTARCIAVSDGDTIKVLKDRKQIRIRLYGIDAPEKAQAFGQ